MVALQQSSVTESLFFRDATHGRHKPRKALRNERNKQAKRNRRVLMAGWGSDVETDCRRSTESAEECHFFLRMHAVPEMQKLATYLYNSPMQVLYYVGDLHRTMGRAGLTCVLVPSHQVDTPTHLGYRRTSAGSPEHAKDLRYA